MKKTISIIAAALTGVGLLMGAAIIGYQDWQLRGSAPGNPASGYLRMWADTTSGTFKCLTSAGAACYFDSTGSAGVTSFTGDGTLISNSASTGSVTATLANAAAHTFWGNNTGSSAAPGYQTIGAADLPTALSSSTSVNGTSIPSSGTLTQTIASGTASLGTSAISSAACATVVTVSATGTASTDTISFAPNASIKAVTGYTPAVTGGLTIAAYPTANNVNFDVCNWTASSITPGAVTLNFRVTR